MAKEKLEMASIKGTPYRCDLCGGIQISFGDMGEPGNCNQRKCATALMSTPIQCGPQQEIVLRLYPSNHVFRSTT